jgi:hypothetical protein
MACQGCEAACLSEDNNTTRKTLPSSSRVLLHHLLLPSSWPESMRKSSNN